MKRKGFTLIELLAVIVILAIIALIATPIIMNMIENSRKGAAERTADNYFDAVEVAVGTERVDGNVLEGEYEIDSDGNLVKDGETIKINMNGNKPSSGTIFIENGLVTTSSTMTIGDYTVSYDNTKKSYVASKEQTGTNTSYICEKTGEASKTVGAEYTCHLDTDRTFYVLENIESSENISLIMDRNFTDEVVPKTLAWCINDVDNNKTCKNINSKEERTPLKHIQDTFGDKVTVSLPTANQIATASGKTFDESDVRGLQPWLHDYLKNRPNPVPDVTGYWTASPHAQYVFYAWEVGYGGGVFYSSISSAGYYGVRPVITISKDQLD